MGPQSADDSKATQSSQPSGESTPEEGKAPPVVAVPVGASSGTTAQAPPDEGGEEPLGRSSTSHNDERPVAGVEPRRRLEVCPALHDADAGESSRG